MTDLGTFKGVNLYELSDLIGTSLASFVSGNNQPCMSGDPRDRIPAGRRKYYDEACRELAHSILAALEPAEPETDAEPTRKVICEALRFANWAAGQGICPVEGEPASAPEDFLMEYSNATDDEDWEGLANRIYTHPPESRLREDVERIERAILDDREGKVSAATVLHMIKDAMQR